MNIKELCTTCIAAAFFFQIDSCSTFESFLKLLSWHVVGPEGEHVHSRGSNRAGKQVFITNFKSVSHSLTKVRCQPHHRTS